MGLTPGSAWLTLYLLPSHSPNSAGPGMLSVLVSYPRPCARARTTAGSFEVPGLFADGFYLNWRDLGLSVGRTVLKAPEPPRPPRRRWAKGNLTPGSGAWWRSLVCGPGRTRAGWRGHRQGLGRLQGLQNARCRGPRCESSSVCGSELRKQDQVACGVREVSE